VLSILISLYHHRLVLENTDILVGIKAELGEPDATAPDCGTVFVSVEWYVMHIVEIPSFERSDLSMQLQLSFRES
jgi:exosome complex RNA-binding protein Rrp42 (RNase PH superfamily)